ncbi:MAG: ROK family protein [Colwellia sp.]
MAVYGLDIGGTKIETAIFDDDLNLLESWRIKTPTQDYPLLLETIAQQLNKADQISSQHARFGIGMPGLINHQGQVLSANVPCATEQFIKSDLEKLLGRPVAIKNDTRLFALSEAMGGAGQGFHRVFGAIIGTGAAGGLCINGSLENTNLGVAGEYGHLPLSAQLQQKYQLPILRCGCGLLGCVERYITGPGIENLYQHFTSKAQTAIFWGDKLKQGDRQAHSILTCYLDILGETFASLVKLQEPDVIVLGGGLSLVPDIVKYLPRAIENHLFTNFNAPAVVIAKYGDSSGVRGAAILGCQ